MKSQLPNRLNTGSAVMVARKTGTLRQRSISTLKFLVGGKISVRSEQTAAADVPSSDSLLYEDMMRLQGVGTAAPV